MKGRINPSNFYRTTLTGTSINDTDETGTFSVTDKTVQGYTLKDGDYTFWLIFAIDDMTIYEIFRCTSVSGTDVTYDLRISPNGKQTHDSGTLISMNDFAEVIRYMANQIDDFGYTETIPGTGNELKTKTYGGRIFVDGAVDVIAPDTITTYPISTTTYLYYDDITNAFGTTTVEPGSYYVVAKIVTDGTTITSITDYRSNIVNGGSGGGSGGGHTIKNTDQAGTETVLPQRDTLRVKKIKTTDDPTNLETVLEGKWIATPDYIETDTTEYIEENTQMIVEGTLTVDGTLDNSGSLILI